MSFEKGGDMEEMVEIDIIIIPELSEIDKLKLDLKWIWSAIDEINSRIYDLELATEICEPPDHGDER